MVNFKKNIGEILVYATRYDTVMRSFKIALVVGSINAFINQFDAVFLNNFSIINSVQIFMTFFVPYCVATTGAVMQAKSDKRKIFEKLKRDEE